MKGVVFNEFFDQVETSYGCEVVERLSENIDSGSENIYVPEDNYDFLEFRRLIDQLSKEVGKSSAQLMMRFGEHLFSRLAILYRPIFAGRSDVFDFLECLGPHFHNHIKNLYPDSELPRIQTKRLDDHSLELLYRSKRRMANLAHGLLNGCQHYFNEELRVEMEYLSTDGSIVRFVLTRE
jgi:hypothetical protein